MTPKEHPTFQRAMQLAHQQLMNQREKISTRVDLMMNERSIDIKEASSLALAEMAQNAYKDSVEQLQAECSRIGRIEYTMSGIDFLEDAIMQISSKEDEAVLFVIEALKKSCHRMPQKVVTVHEFGLREDGLIFGYTQNEAIGGSFEKLQLEIQQSLDQSAFEYAKSQRVDDEISRNKVKSLVSKTLSTMNSTMRSIAERRDSSEFSMKTGRPLCCFAKDLASKITKMKDVTINFDNETRHTVTGKQASSRLLKVSKEASDERPEAANISNFFLKVGI